RALALGALDVDVDPLVVARQLGEAVDHALRHLEWIAPLAEGVADLGLEPRDVVEGNFFHGDLLSRTSPLAQVPVAPQASGGAGRGLRLAAPVCLGGSCSSCACSCRRRPSWPAQRSTWQRPRLPAPAWRSASTCATPETRQRPTSPPRSSTRDGTSTGTHFP